MNKKFTVTVKCHCKQCNKDHRALYSSLAYTAPDAISAARKAHEYLADGGAYRDLCHLAKDKTIFFVVKERGTPKGEGITTVEQSIFLKK